MKNILILIIGILLVNTSFGQEIEMKLNFLGYQFIQNGEKLNWQELIKVTESVPEANSLIKKAKSHKTITSVVSAIGGGFIGIPLGQSISGRDPNWTFAYIGGGILVAIGIPLSSSVLNKANKGVDKYNLSLKSSSASNIKPEFKIIANGNGLGLSINF